MKRYLVLLLTAALLLSVLVVPGAVIASRKGAAETGAAPAKFYNNSQARARSAPRQLTGPISKQAVGFAESAPLRDLPDAPATQPRKKTANQIEKTEREVNEKNSRAIRKINPDYKPEPDGALNFFVDGDAKMDAAEAPAVLPTPSVVFDGNSNADNASLFGFRLSPPDTEGDVGPNHYVQVINLTIRIFDKVGTPLIPAKKFSTIFTALGAPCGAEDGGDPIALYDPMADRWMLSQFCFPFGDTTPPFFETIAVSKTPDPTGAYYLYNFDVSAGNNEFPDYPHLGVWPDGYYMTTNQFLNGGSFDGGGVFAFDRRKMLVGDPSASFIYFNRNLASFPEAQAGMLPADMDGVRPPPPGAPCPFAYFTATEFTDPADGMRIFDFHADFATPANSTFIERPESAAVPGGGIPVAAFNPLAPAGRDAVPQPAPASNTTARLDAISDRLMHRLQYINFGTHESLTVTNTVNVGTDQTLANYRAGLRFYQFRKVGGGANPWTVFEQGTYAGTVPATDTTHRWMGSAAQNAAGDLAIGYSASSSSVFPSIRYAARFAADTPGTLAQGEQTMFAGTGVQTDTGSRWGDYSSLSLDPADDCSFWFTTETYTAASQATSGVGWLTKIGKFNLGSACTAFPKGTISGTVTNCSTGLPVPDAVVQTSDGFFTTTDALGNYTLPKMTPSSYSVSATKSGFSTATANSIAVTNGNTTTQNFCIVPAVILANGGNAIVSAGGNGTLDPGETVTVSLGVQNTGGPGACTTALTGTLQATGGVTLPSGPQNFGAICSGDPAVFRNYTFKVDPNLACGAPVTLTLNLLDGATPYASQIYTFVTGASGAGTNFSYTGPPVAIPDNNATGVNIPVVVSGLSGNLGDFNFRVDGSSCNATIGSTTNGIDHTWVGDLIITVTSPQGTTVSVFDRPGVPASSVGFSGNNICNMLLDDEGGFPLVENVATAPVTGNFKPNNPMSAFDGQNPNGTWTINVSDRAGQDTGSVRAFTLQIATFNCQAVTAPRVKPFDFTADGKADLSVFSAGSTSWTVQDSASLVSAPSLSNWGTAGDKLVPADYDGDLKYDVAVFRQSDGNWYILNSGGVPAVSIIGWGALGDKPVPADYDGDGKADAAVFRGTEGNWYVKYSGGGSAVAGWGNASDILVPGDYDNDGRSDFAVYRPSDGNWYIRTNPAAGSPSVIVRNWGGFPTDKPVPADYDGDGKTDIAIYRASEFNFYIINSSTNTVSIKSWGINGDILVPADYDGDGKADVAIVRPAPASQWWILQSSTNTVRDNGTPGFPPTTGVSGDIAIPSTYIELPNIP
ncbi:MAG TPA: FG-GAP-like repeat-containing protein [Pyrinomonadaceae bacterium]